MDIVMPLVAADLDRYLRLQRPTLERFYGDLGTTWVIVPRSQRSEIERATTQLSNVRVIDERTVVPELVLEHLLGRRGVRNWHVQQLIKLAAVACVDTPFALVLDADVVTVRRVSDSDLVVDGRALRPTEAAKDHPDWVAHAADVLGVEPIAYTASVTPSVLARDAVRLLAEYVQGVVRPRRRRVRAAAMVPVVRRLARSWRGRLLGALPWTEYQLYDTFLVRTENFDHFHRYSTEPVLYGNCVWERSAFDSWQATPQTPFPTYFFSVVQGNAGIPVDAVESRLRAAGLLDPRAGGTS